MRVRQLVAGGWALLGASVLAQSVPGSGDDFQAALWGAGCMSCHGTDGRAEGTGLSIGGRAANELQRIAVYFSKLK